MKRQIIYRITLLLAAALSLWHGATAPLPAQAAPLGDTARFTELTVVLSRKDLLLFALLNGSTTDEMEEVLHSGIPLEFTFFTELLRTTQGTTEQLQTHNFTHTIRYNTLTEEYRVEFSENSNRNSTFPTLDTAIQALENINGLPITPANQLLPNNSYRLRIRANLFHKKLPPGLRSLQPFITWNSRKTKWQAVDFSY